MARGETGPMIPARGPAFGPDSPDVLVRQIVRAPSRDQIERLADEHVSLPGVALVHVIPPTGADREWRAEIYTAPRPGVQGILVNRRHVDDLIRRID